MLDSLEGRETFADGLIVNSAGFSGKGCSHGVVDVVLSAEREFLEIDICLILLVSDYDLVVLEEGSLLDFVLLGERQKLGLSHFRAEMVDRYLVVRVEDKAVFRTEVANYPEFRLHVILHLVVVPVEVVRGDVCDYRDVGTEVIAVVQLETAYFQYVIVVLLGGHLISVAHSDIASQTYVEACLLEQVVDQGSSRGLSVGSGNTDLLGRIVTACELDFGDYSDSFLFDLLHHRNGRRYARALDDLVGIQNQFLSMLTLLERDIPFLESLDILPVYLSLVGKKDIESFDFREYCGTHTAFRTA